jgi:hypothetical protein
VKLPLVSEINWDACISNIKGRNWQHAHNMVVDIFNMCCNNHKTLSVVVNVENSNKSELKKIFSSTKSKCEN